MFRGVIVLACLLMYSGCKEEELVKVPEEVPSQPDYAIQVTTFAGTPTVSGYVDGKEALFSNPAQMVFDPRDQMLYVADQGIEGLVIRSIDLAGNVDTYVPQDVSIFEGIGDLCLAPGEAGSLYMSSTRRDALYKIEKNAAGKGSVSQILGFAGSGNADGDFQTATLDGPRACVADKEGNLLLANDYYHTIKKVDFSQEQVTPFVGKAALQALDPGGFKDGTGESSAFNGIHDMAISADQHFVVVTDYSNHALRKIELQNREVTTLFGGPLKGIDKDGSFDEAEAGYPEVAVCAGNNLVYFSSAVPGFNGGAKVRVAILHEQEVYTIAGGQGSVKFRDGTGMEARFNGIRGMAITPDGSTLFISDQNNHCIRKIRLF